TILVSSSVCVEVARRFIRSEGPQVLCVPFSVDTRLFHPIRDRAALRRALHEEVGVPRDGPLLLVVSAFVKRKNQHLALRFLRALLDTIPDARLAFVGGAPSRGTGESYLASVRSAALRDGLFERVTFLGELPQSRVSRLMAVADLLLHLSNCRLENFGLVVAEAMAAGLPVVAADWGGLRDLVVSGETGLLVPTFLTDGGPRTDWLSAVGPTAGILSDRGTWERMSSNARGRAERDLSVAAYRRRLCAAVDSTLERPAHDGTLALTEQGTDLMFRTILLNSAHPEIDGTGTEYRLLMPIDDGRHYRFLSGPAASSQSAPNIGANDRLYPVATWTREGAALRITDLAWPATLPIEDTQTMILERSDGRRTLGQIFEDLCLPREMLPGALAGAQSLVDQGVLCPLGGTPIRRLVRRDG
ncbi:MAG TPA: glycosyltransferase family 4 protein, partial [Candidatus Polarisedimenticolia bacterium]|nr:glycosyltransferase family 4 protein [Candidatus Polarisedimenticolia bacterium]